MRTLTGVMVNGHDDFETRCIRCRRIAYTCSYGGARTAAGFVCEYCMKHGIEREEEIMADGVDQFMGCLPYIVVLCGILGCLAIVMLWMAK